MLTGDSRTTADAVARRLGIDEVHAEVLPEGKLQILRRLQHEAHVVAMAGDGVNDAPALAAADVGIAMGTGTDVAIESAGVTLVKGDLGGIVRARRLSRLTMTNIRQNLVFAFVVQRRRRADCRGCAVSLVRVAAESHDRGGGHERELGFGDCECVAFAARPGVMAACVSPPGLD